MQSESIIVVRYAETDQMGVAHHSHYPVWFEVGRTNLLNSFGSSYGDIERAGVLLPLYELRCKFASPARYEDELVIRTRISQLTRVRASFAYEIVHVQSERLIATGETLHAWTDRNLRPINVQKRIPEAYALLESIMKL